jgi:ArsR family transcriptional regulator, arsenate/arsenite/antimonite-responsive transcriptional repressor
MIPTHYWYQGSIIFSYYDSLIALLFALTALGVALGQKVSTSTLDIDTTRFLDIFTLMAVETHSRTERAVELFHALSDETRLEIIELLRKGERCVCELTDTLDAAQSRLSFHLRVLKDAGIVRDRKDGRWVHYELDPASFEDMEVLVSGMKPRAVRRADQCCA